MTFYLCHGLLSHQGDTGGLGCSVAGTVFWQTVSGTCWAYTQQSGGSFSDGAYWAGSCNVR